MKVFIFLIFSVAYLNSQVFEEHNLYSMGFPNGTIYGFLNDDKGRLWIATTDGLIKYEDKEWYLLDDFTAGFPHRKVMQIKQDREGNLWLGSFFPTFLAKLNETTNEWELVEYTEESGSVRYLFFNKDNYPIIGGQASIKMYNGSEWINVYERSQSGNDVYDIILDSNDNIWYSLFTEGIYKYKDGITHNVLEYYNEKIILAVRNFFIGKDKKIWFNLRPFNTNVRNSIPIIYDLETNHYEEIIPDNPDTFIQFRGVIDNEGYYWHYALRELEESAHYLVRYDRENDSWLYFESPNGIIIGFIAYDKTRNDIWITQRDILNNVYRLDLDIASVKAEKFTSSIDIFPNPAINIINVNTEEDYLISQYTILDLNGKKISSSNINSSGSFSVNVESLSKGIYFLELKNKEGLSYLKKFVKE